MTRSSRRVLIMLGGALLVFPFADAGAQQMASPESEKLRSAATRLRVGLATDRSSVTLPWTSGQLVAEADGRLITRISTLRIEPDVDVLSPGVFRLQVAALKDEAQAHRLAEQLGQTLTDEADVVFDAGSDLYRVRVGDFQTREEAERTQGRLALAGIDQAWLVTEKGVLGEPALRLSQADRELRVPGRWVAIRSIAREAGGIRLLEGQYRGRILVYLNDRGLLNVINELSVEEYLRGVIPREMGPEVYDSLEALKAQTVAARTYTLKNLGEFADEGYDICATPRCQVYGGMAVEHALTDRAVAETAGEVLMYRGELVEALYSSTCGGHTENVAVMFPLKNQPYLRGVACLESGVDRLAGSVPRGVPFPQGLMQQVLPPSASGLSAEGVGARFEHLAVLAGLAVPEDRLRSLERREVQRFIASIFDLALDARLFVAPEDLTYLLDQPPSDWTERDLRLAAYLMKSGLLSGDLDEPLDTGEIEETLFRLALHLRVLEAVSGRYLGTRGGNILLRGAEGEVWSFGLPERYGTYRLASSRRTASPVSLLAGDRVDLYLHSGQLLGVTHEVDVAGAAYDRDSKFSSWTRFRSDAELRRLVQERYPGLMFRDFEILERGVSGRVGKIRLRGEDGRSVDVEGLAVRWTLDVPDTLFTAKRLIPPGRSPGWLFTGRGWGHGVGLCQIGAFGMAQRGHSYRDILLHYYSGVEIGQAPPAMTSARHTEP